MQLSFVNHMRKETGAMVARALLKFGKNIFRAIIT